MNTRNTWSTTIVVLAGVVLGGCNWVDSANGGSTPDVPPVVTQVLLDDIPIGAAEVINESSVALITARPSTSSLERTFTWSEEPLEQGNLSVCAGTDGFNPELAAQTLESACTLATDCNFEFVNLSAVSPPEAGSDTEPPIDEGTTPATGDTVFELRIPALQASVGARYALIEEDSSGNVFNTEYSFCLIAINEAPEANDDTFVILEGDVLNVTQATVNLLSNDRDDVDVSNAPLTIVPEPLLGPENAAVFEMGDDGSFTYESSLVDLREDQFDVFQYEVTDGLFTSTAEVTIRVVAINQAPRLLDVIDDLSATEDEPFTANLAPSFFDPENGNLTFTLSAATPLATGTGLSLSRNGLLSGTPTAADVGVYELTVVVSDGGQITPADFILEVGETNNRAPVFETGSIPAEITGPRMVIMRIAPEFSDPDNDRLTYSMSGNSRLPNGLSINRTTGVISGRPSVSGVYEDLRVRATDPFDKSALSSVFTITIVGN